MSSLNAYIEKRGISANEMQEARARTQATIDAYALRKARKAAHLTQVELAQAMGVSQNRVSRMENGDIGTMSIDTVKRYIEALGGSVAFTAELPSGTLRLA